MSANVAFTGPLLPGPSAFGLSRSRWEATLTHATVAVLEGQREILLSGRSDSLEIVLAFFGGVGMHPLTDDQGTLALVEVFTPTGVEVIYTDREHTGYVMVTQLDSLSIAGTFEFDTSARSNGSRTNVRSGTFHLPVQMLGAVPAPAGRLP